MKCVTSEITQLFKDAQSALNNKQYDIAKAICKKIIKVDSQNVKAYTACGEVICQEMIAINGQLIRGVSNKTVSEIREKTEILHNEADKWFRNAIKVDPKYVNAYSNLGELKAHYAIFTSVDGAYFDARNIIYFL